MSSQCVQVQVQFVLLRLPVIGEDTQCSPLPRRSFSLLLDRSVVIFGFG